MAGRGVGLFKVALIGSALATAIIALVVAVERGGTEALIVLAGICSLGAACAPVALKRRYELLEPMSLVVLTVLVGVTLRSLYIGLGPEELVRFMLLDKPAEELLHGSLLIALGLACLSFGYMSRLPRWQGLARFRTLSRDEWSGKKTHLVLLLFLVIAIGSTALFAIRVGVSFETLSDISSKRLQSVDGSEYRTALGYHRWGAGLAQSAFYLVFVLFAASRKRLRSKLGLACVFLGALSVLFPIFTSSRVGVLIPMVRGVMIWLCLRGRIPMRAITAGIVAGLLSIMVLTALRKGADDSGQVAKYLGLAPVVDVMIGGRQFLDIGRTAHTVNAVPEILDFQYGKTFLTWLVAPIPRTVWPEKPPIGLGVVVGPAVFSTVRSGVPPGFVGELYMNFGFVGVLGGMFFLGLLLNLLYRSFRPLLWSRGAVLLYSILVYRLTIDLLNTDSSSVVVRTAIELMPLVMALVFIQSRTRRQVFHPQTGSGWIAQAPKSPDANPGSRD